MRRARLSDASDLLPSDIARTFDDVPNPDVLLAPGGNTTRQMTRDGAPIIDWIRSAHDTRPTRRPPS